MTSAPHDLIANIRLRPGMFVGDAGTLGLHHLAYVLLDLPFLGAGSERATEVLVRVEPRGVLTVEDDRPPVPVDRLLPMIRGELAATPGTGFEWECPVPLALSSEYTFEIWDGGVHSLVRGSAGRPGKLQRDEAPRQGECFRGRSGTRISVRPDPGIFGDVRVEPERLQRRVQELAPLLAATRFHLELPGLPLRTYAYPGGLGQRVLELARDRELRHPEPLVVEASWEDVHVRAALLWSEEDPCFSSFANSVHTRKHGSHVEGVFDALCAALEVPRFLPFLKSGLARGLVGIVSCEAPARRLKFQGPTKELLAINGLREGVALVLRPQFERALEGTGLRFDLKLLQEDEDHS